MHDSADRTTRRSFLAGLGGLGFVGLGTAAGRISATINARASDSQTGDDPLTDPDGLEAFVDDVMAERIGTTPGATVAIVSGDTPLLVKGYGAANADTEEPVRADETAFRIGSVGKLVTWTAVMQSVERGVLDLDEDVNTYLDDSEVTVQEAYDAPVTLHHLGTHTAGFESALDPDIVASPAAIVPLETLLTDQQPARVRPPGELVGYSNYGAALAGHIVAEANDTTFEEYVQSEIFDPLDMTHSTFAQPVPEDHPGTLAAGHSRDGETFTTAEDVFINMRPAGSMSATATDMAAFMSAHLGDGAVGSARILSAQTAEAMHAIHHVRHPAVTNWRYGFHEYGAPDANLIGHSGATIDFASQLVLAPDHDVGIFVNYNTNSDESPSAVVDEIIAELDLQPSPTPPTPTSVPGGRERAETVAGEYSATYLPDSGPLHMMDLMEHVTVEATDSGRLLTKRMSGDARQWIETDPYVYREKGGHNVLAFEITGSEVTAMNMSSEPTGVYRPVPFADRKLVTAGVVGSSVAGFGLSLAGRGALGAWRRWKGSDNSDESPMEEAE
ncbi:serine hydrolase domain-containing protein [Natrinema sp. 1APR25-10V2]|uniref:serine hydrolase domain-containing protein n=1 Tax=Natrinema sp. 1APR25-10V2 TaxID=2951081 RepID=UPI00287B9379|nr:serine hydrolase domain-containing protein [Natrinema sp. 1APR25-10V2]